MRKSLGFILFLLLVFTGKAFAASITYSEVPQHSSFSHTDELSFKAKLLINASDGTNYYLRGVFYEKDTNKYCGYTWNTTSYFSGPYSANEGWKQFLKVTVQDNMWEGEIRARIDTEDSNCSKSGEYGFKVQRFTESGSANFDEQDESYFTFSIPTPTPTPTPTSTPTPTQKPTKPPTSTPTKDVETTLSKPPSQGLLTKAQASSTPSSTPRTAIVLGVNEKETVTPLPEEAKEISETQPLAGKIILISGGVLMASSCGILMYKRYKTGKPERL